METKTIQISPPYLQFFISDPDAENIPQQVSRSTVISSGECVSVLCQYEFEGPTELVVGRFEEVSKDGLLAFDGVIPTPSRTLWFSDAERTELARVPVSSSETRLRIFTDGMEFPARVVVAVE